ncbi:MAG TPA: DUF6165 family protein [Methylocella sp.]|nr:DUF6165 family protein [Methylocella sp.]
MSLPKVEQPYIGNKELSVERELLQVSIKEAFELLNTGRPNEAIGCIERYQDIAAQSEAGCYIFGLIHLSAGDPRAALDWINRALRQRPGFFEALSVHAIILQRLGQPHDALSSLDEALKQRPHDAETLFAKGVILQSLGQLSEALICYDDALSSNGSYCEALTNRGALLERFGRLEEALACFKAIEKIKPHESSNLFNMGSVLQKLGRHQEALAAYEEAARCGPADAETELNRGNALQKLGRLEEALSAYDLSLEYRRGYPQAYYNKGIALQGLSKPKEALAAYEAALELNPSYYEASCNRGNVLHELGRLGEALAAFHHTLKIRPGFLPALTNRASVLLQLGRVDEALLASREVLKQHPEHPQCLCVHGAALHKLGRLEEALIFLENAIKNRPAPPDAWLNRGNVLQELDRIDEAIASYGEALDLNPHYPEALSGLGVALKEAGRLDDALANFDLALSCRPNFADARNNRGGALLLKGNLGAGFADLESRWDRSNAPPKTITLPIPLWTGQDPKGKSILVWDEQGLGDLIQFSRYLIHLVEAGADVTLMCRGNMHRLLRALPASIRLVESVDANGQFDLQIALMSLPYAFRTTLESIPSPVPYLSAEPALVSKWAERVGAYGFRVGVAWQGNKFINLKRSIPLACFAPIARIGGVRLISLMKEQGRLEVSCAGGNFVIESAGMGFDAGYDSFIDCAAVMANVDLIITSDTAIAHLAGALGRPVFLALKHVPDWRWLMGRGDCPWYPSMTLFRQATRGEWDPVFGRIAESVEAKIAKKSCEITELQPQQAPAIPTSIGELIDKITILEIKEKNISNPSKLKNIRLELSLLRQLKSERGYYGEELMKFERELKDANSLLWKVEDELREHETKGDFGTSFVSLARQVYKTNDLRAGLKKKINLLFNSLLIEEKSYPTYFC